MSPPLLSVRNLRKTYGPRTAVHDVSFDIRPGQILGVVGPNGSGKSTIVKIVTGLIEPSGGAVHFGGAPVAEQFESFRQSLGYVPEQADLYGFLTGWEYVEMVAGLRGIPRRKFRLRALALFEALQLSDARDRSIRGYSKGMRQRIAIIAALLHNPSFLVLDEPFSGLDVTSGLVLRRVIQLLAQKGKTIFFSSPSLDHLEQVSTELLVLRSGRVVAAGPSEEVRRGFGGLNLEKGFLALAGPAGIEGLAAAIVETTCALDD